jgi:hypothetical protein
MTLPWFAATRADGPPPRFGIDERCQGVLSGARDCCTEKSATTTITHGNAGYMTFFRNYSSSQFASPPVAKSTAKQTGNIIAIQFDTGDIGMTVIGNVLGSSAATDLGTAPLSKNFIGDGNEAGAIFSFGSKGKADVSYTSLRAHGNFDTVNGSVQWNPNIAVQTIPPSLYLSAKPAWWPSTSPWPWVGPDLSPMVGVLPAKARSDQMAP